ncbi:hypothetical protein SAMN05216406_1261, partial [Nitrosomonas ureae]
MEYSVDQHPNHLTTWFKAKMTVDDL